MALSGKVQQLKAQTQGLKNTNHSAFFAAPGTYSDWEGYNLAEFQEAFNYCIGLIEDGFAKNVFPKLSVAALNTVINNIANSAQHCQQLFINPGNQSHFQQAGQAVDGLVNTLHMYNVPLLVSGGADL